MTTTATDRITIRNQTNWGKFYLSAIKTRSLLTATLTGFPSQGDTSITYSGGAGVDFADITDGMTLLVTTQYGNEFVRVKSISGTVDSGTITTAVNSVDWRNGQTLTIVDDYRLHSYISRFTASTFYKDWDDTYTDEGSQPPPVCIAGGHDVGWVKGSYFKVDVDLSDSYAIADGVAITDYACTVQPSTGATVQPLGGGLFEITITQAGQYWRVCTVTDSNGKTQTTRRRIFAHNPGETSDDYPLTDINVRTLHGDIKRGGWTLNIEARDAEAGLIDDDYLVVLWTDSTPYSEQVLFAGYVTHGTIQRDYTTGTVSFTATTIEARLNDVGMYAVSLSAVRSPATWNEYAIWMTTGRAVHSIWRWHSNLFELADVVGLAQADDPGRQYAEIPQGSLWRLAQSITKQAQAFLCSTRQGAIHYTFDWQLLSDTDRDNTVAQYEIVEGDVLGSLTITARKAQWANVNVSGLSFEDGATGAYCARAPGEVLLPRGATMPDKNRLVVNNAAQVERLAGRYLAEANNPYPNVRADFNGCLTWDFEPALQPVFELSLATADNPRRFAWNNKRLVARTVRINIDNESGRFSNSVTFDVEAAGPSGELVECLSGAVIAQTAAGSAGTEVPGWVSMYSNPLVVTFGDHGLEYWQDDGNGWQESEKGLTGDDAKCLEGGLDPFWFLFAGERDASDEQKLSFTSNATAARLFRPSVSGAIYNGEISSQNTDTYPEITPINAPTNDWSDATAPALGDVTFGNIVGNQYQPGEFYTLATWQNGSSEYRGWLLRTTNYGASWLYYDLYSSLPDELKPIGIYPDQTNGDLLWITIWRETSGNGVLRLLKWTVSTMTFTEVALGNATIGQVETEDRLAHPFSQRDSGGTVFVYGNMDAPAGLSGAQHIIKTTNKGSTFTSVESGWGATTCAWFFADADDNYYAVRQ